MSDADRSPAKDVHRSPWTIVALALFVVASSAMWIYAFFLAPSGNPDRLTDRAWVAQASRSCARTVAALDELPRAGDAADPAERADSLDAATDELAAMIDRLDEIPSVDADDARTIDRWLADYRIYVGDRRRHAERLRTEGDVAIQMTATDSGGGIDAKLTGFARANEMEDCGPPEDVA